jgi:hypothetical protein
MMPCWWTRVIGFASCGYIVITIVVAENSPMDQKSAPMARRVRSDVTAVPRR